MSPKSKINWLIIYLSIITLIFGAQAYYLYFDYIPKNLALYTSLPDVYAQLEQAFYSIAGRIRVWFLLLVSNVVGLMIGIYITRKSTTPNTRNPQ